MSDTNEFDMPNIGNYYGCLSVKSENNKYYWSIENYDGHDYEEIPHSLYVELVKYKDRNAGVKQ